MDQLIKFKLVPGQSAPDDGYATGISIGDDWIVWKGPENTFPLLDPHSQRPLTHEPMIGEDIAKYDNILVNIDEDVDIHDYPDGGTGGSGDYPPPPE